MPNMKKWKSGWQYGWGSMTKNGTATDEAIGEMAIVIRQQEEAKWDIASMTGEIKARRGNNVIMLI
jgi:hypothetical protein